MKKFKNSIKQMSLIICSVSLVNFYFLLNATAEVTFLYRSDDFTIKWFQTSGDVLIESLKPSLRIVVPHDSDHTNIGGTAHCNIGYSKSDPKKLVLEKKNMIVLFKSYFKNNNSITIDDVPYSKEAINRAKYIVNENEGPIDREEIRIFPINNIVYPTEINLDDSDLDKSTEKSESVETAQTREVTSNIENAALTEIREYLENEGKQKVERQSTNSMKLAQSLPSSPSSCSALSPCVVPSSENENCCCCIQ